MSGRYPAHLAVLLLITGCSFLAPPQAPQEPPTVQSEAADTSIVVDTARASCHYQQQREFPDPNCTPGVWDPNVTQATISTTICRSGYTREVRPSATYTNAIKQQQLRAYGVINPDLRKFEEDHYFPLEGGGHPTEPRNLWPEPSPSIPNPKDAQENRLHDDICSGKYQLEDAHRRWETLGWKDYR